MTTSLIPEQSKILHAFADGEKVQFRQLVPDAPWKEMRLVDTPLIRSTAFEFRIKPKPKPEVVRLRLSVHRGAYGLYTLSADDEADARANARLSDLLGWDGPWREVDVSTLTKD